MSNRKHRDRSHGRRPVIAKQRQIPSNGGTFFLRARDLAQRWDVHETTIWKWCSKGLLPPPTELGPNVRGWGSNVIEALEAERTPAAAQ